MKPHFTILPTILETTPEEARAKIQTAQQCSDWIQVDVMDGKFVPNTTWHNDQDARKWAIRSNIELDLMVKDPRRIIEAWKDVAKCKRVIWHVELDIDHQELINDCKDMGKEVGLAISPKTSLLELAAYLHRIDVVLVMGVEPGASGQEQLPETAKRVSQIHEMNKEVAIEVDGGVNDKNILALAKAGATRFAMNKAVYTHAFPRDFVGGQLQRLERLVE